MLSDYSLVSAFTAWRNAWPDERVRRMTSLAARGLIWELMTATDGSGLVRVGEPTEPTYLQNERLRALILRESLEIAGATTCDQGSGRGSRRIRCHPSGRSRWLKSFKCCGPLTVGTRWWKTCEFPSADHYRQMRRFPAA